jgi:WD40 repeat protein
MLYFPPQTSTKDIVVPSECRHTIDASKASIHTTNILSLLPIPGHSDLILTSSASRDLVLTQVSTSTVVARYPGVLNAVALSADAKVVSTTDGSSSQLQLVVGLMNGEVLVLGLDNLPQAADAATGRAFSTLWQAKLHAKYVVGVQWTPFGFATASHDNTACVVVDAAAAAKATSIALGGAAAPETLLDASAVGACAEGVDYRLVKRVTCRGQVECLAVCQEDDAAAASIVIGVRDDHLLHVLSPATGAEDAGINLNALGDDHVSFTPLSLAYRRGGFLAVATDMHRVIVIDMSSRKQVRNYYGCPNDGFATPKVVWSPCGTALHVSSQNHEIYTFSAQSQKVLKVTRAHDKAIRGLGSSVDAEGKEVLYTTGFDKTIKMWK